VGQHADADCADLARSSLIVQVNCFQDFKKGNAMDQILLKSHDAKRIVVLAALILWCTGMIAVRMERTGSRYYSFLIWNLFLGGIPLVASSCLRVASGLRLNRIIQTALFGLWLLFLPNAPYILTDLLHLTAQSSAPTWYDLALLLSCSGTGLLLGYLSLIDIHGLVARKFSPAIGWTVAVSSLLLSGFAIYLGRFLRWNSWDVLTRPGIVFDIADGLLHPAAHVRTLGVTFIFGIILALGYISLRVLLAHPTVSDNRTTQRYEAT
jgi:uncharacterized membrane protein